MPRGNKRSLDRLKNHNTEGLQEKRNTQRRKRSPGRPSSKSAPPKEGEGHKTKSRSRSRSPRSRHGSVARVVVHPAQERYEPEDKTGNLGTYMDQKLIRTKREKPVTFGKTEGRN